MIDLYFPDMNKEQKEKVESLVLDLSNVHGTSYIDTLDYLFYALQPFRKLEIDFSALTGGLNEKGPKLYKHRDDLERKRKLFKNFDTGRITKANK
jgi:hypothetical protein